MVEKKPLSLSLVEFIGDDAWQHVKIRDQKSCHNCQKKVCLTICPSWVFRCGETDVTSIQVLYRQCLECGACRLVCENIDFSYPHGGFGVLYRQG